MNLKKEVVLVIGIKIQEKKNKGEKMNKVLIKSLKEITQDIKKIAKKIERINRLLNKRRENVHR